MQRGMQHAARFWAIAPLIRDGRKSPEPAPRDDRFACARHFVVCTYCKNWAQRDRSELARCRMPRGLSESLLHAPLTDALGDLPGAFLALAVAVGQIIGAIAQEQRELHQLLHHVHDPVVIR